MNYGEAYESTGAPSDDDDEAREVGRAVRKGVARVIDHSDISRSRKDGTSVVDR